MNKKTLAGGAAALLAGIGLYKYVNSQNGASHSQEKWTTADMPDLSGKVIVVTGANSGIGFEAARAFADKGATTILACRNQERAEDALRRIQDDVTDATAEIMMLDLGSLASVHRFAAEFKEKYDRLDVLVNNAGIMWLPYGLTEDGFEKHFGVNHLGHFALTGLLLDRLLETPDARVVNVSSTGHRTGTMDFDNLMFEDGKGYNRQLAYGRSKLANLLFTYELQRRFEAAGADAMALAAHPGGTETNLGSHLRSTWYVDAAWSLVQPLLQEAAMGALPTLRAAVDPHAQGGQYYGPDGFMEQRGYPIVVQSSAASHDLEAAQKLWQVSEALTGVHYEVLPGNVIR
jgi:NAD(P)-dependent dehydrogenase (short-subunit alcohol dehydrogenase family)